MAAAFLTHLSAGRVEVRSAGSAPAETVNPVVIEAKAEGRGRSVRRGAQVLTIEAVQGSDVVITMGCGDACPAFPGKQYLGPEARRPGWPGRRGGPLDPGRDRRARPRSARRSPSRA
ncbi:arsenate reductase ArsC [Streptomyces sp. NPDC008086]|uniref:arsenate reductase ArsC n=1 Tax=Streptomyces sp. NPDC008086 TaxID=3364807 RepID=UPI0036EC2419